MRKNEAASSNGEGVATMELGDLSARAQSFYAKGRLDEALRCYRDAGSLSALKFADLLLKMRAEYRLERRSDALETIKEILARQSRHAEALKFGGRIATGREDWAAAKDFWQRLAEANPNDPEGALNLARIAYRDGDLAEASVWAGRLLAIAPSHPEGLVISANAGVRLDVPGIGAVLARYFDVDHDRTLSLLRHLSRTGEPENYAEALIVVHEQHPDSAELQDQVAQAARQFMADGLHAEYQSQDLDAARCYKAVRRLRADSANAQKGLDRLRSYALADMHRAQRVHDTERAVAAGLKASEIDPDCLEAWRTMANIHLVAGNIRQARESFARSVVLDPDDPGLWLDYARCLDKLDDLPEALTAYRRVSGFGAKEGAELESERAVRTLHARALTAVREAAVNGDVERAWTNWKVAFSIDPQDDRVVTSKKQLLNQMLARIRELWRSHSPEAIGLCQSYLEHSPGDFHVLRILGRTQMSAGRFADARSSWERLAELQPDDAHYRLQIARCCSRLKQRTDGLAAVGEALRLDPGNREAHTIQQQLEELPKS